MSIEEIRSYRNAKPFQPFVVHLTDGPEMRVPKSWSIAITPWGQIGISNGIILDMVKVSDISEIKLAKAAA